MKYLCDQHRSEFANNPKQATHAWKVIIDQARQLFHTQDWENASRVYGNAFEISELLLVSERTAFSVDRYLRSALEYAYVLRKEGAGVDLSALISHVSQNIKNVKHTLSLELLVKPLEDVIRMPMHLADFWMLSLLSLDHIESRVLH